MTFDVLATAVGWESQIPEPGSLTTITDTTGVDPTVLLLHIVSSSLKVLSSSEAIVLVSFEQIFMHYNRILRKMGTNVDAARKAKKMYFVDGVSEISSFSNIKKYHVDTSDNVSKVTQPDGVIKNLLQLSQEQIVAELIQAIVGCDSSTNTGEGQHLDESKKIKGVFIHGLSVLTYLGYTSGTIRCFIDTLKTFLQINGGFLVILTNADKDIISDLEAEDDYVSLLTGLYYQSDLILQVGPLISGYSVDVTGQIAIVCKPHYKEKIPGPLLLHYKTLENKALFFAPGQKLQF
ncbi:hypothetical protein BB560_002146 [Smittium megazygosporum]|uniref:Elongator complex protein 6 n=1 Tax=Smittium megazygosporum TaxID=133381 RepID=A0A2T9Z715_9FUNG|nr:hypothetical protein BB560_005246 [Smittium megazygosporum]PVV03375.1 hypothetical protein BB560_002146 [Smittium megazygosporum]